MSCPLFRFTFFPFSKLLQDIVHDTWRWLFDPTHGYMVREAYRFLTNNGELVDMTLVDDVWHKHIPSKVSLFVWRLLCNRLPTIDSLVRRSLWAHVWHWLGISSVHLGDFRNHFIQYTNMTGLSRVTHSFL
ncbi:putative reverse transcriptase zinc-binding domain-containing protein [Medicago truncatula]|uniref:Putative reverse transcriptase zinc-binding domain-containing protein n=1 Tax=Medicago truncatula TaxID=3880 RepID=A0A396JPL7_MEDTR|nr:putative reverse transcriptase zinc-binding domain-containing protein [Medicago truncatula]